MVWSDGLVFGSQAYLIASSSNQRIRVVAGPGTGKSFAMKRRVARMLESGIAPNTILPVTFTRVASEDLHRELVGMGVPGCDQLKGVTLHSLGMRILMRNHVLAATGRKARPLNEFELEPLFSDLMRPGLGKRELKRLKQAFEAGWARLQHEQPGFVADPIDAEFAKNLYSWLNFHDAMLIGEIIPQLYEYLRSNPAAQERYEFGYILVDEYQDLNKVEQGVIELLSNAAEVCIVGDDDQSIYSFKHAHPAGIQEWLVSNRLADDLSLLECRRCPTLVVDMANSLISNNVNRPVPRALTPIPANGQGDVRIVQYTELSREVSGVADMIQTMVDAGTPPGDILVLAQRSAIGTPIFEALQERTVPVKSYYAESELNGVEARWRFAILKLLIRRDDSVALRYLIGLNSANWHAPSYRRVRDQCETAGLRPWDVLTQLSNGVLSIPYTSPIVTAFNDIVAEINALEALPSLAEVVDALFPDGILELEGLRTLALEALTENPDDREELISYLVESISQPEIPEVVEEVRIMSLHKSKGLSSPVTIISGCVEGLLPKQPEPGTPAALANEQIEEARRLFFVGISRVKALPLDGKPGTLILTYSQRMPIATAMSAGIAPAGRDYGVARLNASRFIRELGPNAPAPIAG